MKAPIIKYTLLAIVGISVALCLWLFKTDSGHYAFCLMNETRWMKAQTQTELEGMIWSYNSTPISPSQSSWGNSYSLKEDERMIQYHILKDTNCPLDVVYNGNGQIQALFTSYE